MFSSRTATGLLVAAATAIVVILNPMTAQATVEDSGDEFTKLVMAGVVVAVIAIAVTIIVFGNDDPEEDIPPSGETEGDESGTSRLRMPSRQASPYTADSLARPHRLAVKPMYLIHDDGHYLGVAISF